MGRMEDDFTGEDLVIEVVRVSIERRVWDEAIICGISIVICKWQNLQNKCTVYDKYIRIKNFTERRE